jgi:hypothetical protein
VTLRAKESRAETITGGLSVLTVRHVRPDMTASDVLAAINMVRRVLIPDLDIYRMERADRPCVAEWPLGGQSGATGGGS